MGVLGNLVASQCAANCPGSSTPSKGLPLEGNNQNQNVPESGFAAAGDYGRSGVSE